MAFQAEWVPNVGLEFYISQLEALIAPDFVSAGKEARELLELRQKIWEHVKQAFIITTNSTKDGAINLAVDSATKQDFTIVDIVSTDTEEKEVEYSVEAPKTELDLLMQAQRKVKNIGGISRLMQRVVDWYKTRHHPKKRTKTVKKQKVTARLYSSDFFEGKDPVGEVLDYLAGEKQTASGDKLYDAIIKRVKETAENSRATGIMLLEKELEEKKDAKLAEIVGETYNPKNQEHVTKVLEKFYYPRVADLGKPLKALTAEINQLEEEAVKLENEQTRRDVGLVIAPTGADNTAQRTYLEEDEKIKDKKTKLAEKRKEFKETFDGQIDIAKKQLDFLFGVNANPIRLTHDAKDDYQRQCNTEESIRQKLAPLYVNFHLTDKGIIRTDDSSLSQRELNIIARSITYFKQKKGFMTQKGFAELVDYILQSIQQEYLTTQGSQEFGDRFRHYSALIKGLDDRETIKNAAQAHPTNLFDYLVNANLRYYLRGEITQEEAANSLRNLRYDEIAQKVFDRNFTEFANQLKEAGREGKPQEHELKDVLDVTIEKIHSLIHDEDGHPFVSVIEKIYKKAANGAQRLAYDYREIFVTKKPQAPDARELELRYGIAPQYVIENHFALIDLENQSKAPKGKAFGR